MKDLPSALFEQCRTILVTCSEFRSDDSLRAVFATSQLKAYSDKIFEANSRELRVDYCLSFLDGRHFREESLLALFLETLSSRYPADDDTRIALNKLAQEVRVALDSFATPESSFTVTPSYIQQGISDQKKVTFSPDAETINIDVGIIVALKEEFTELFSKFENGYIPVRDEETSAHYYLFQPILRSGTKHCSCVATFIGSMGAVKAALVTEKLMSRWHPQILVIIGIAGSLDDEVKLGDIIVVDQVNMYLENSKAVPAIAGREYTFQISPEVYRSNYDLFNAIQHMEYSHQEAFHNWKKQCTVELQHIALQEKIAEMVRNEELREHSVIHFGHLASGPTVGGADAFKNWVKQFDRKYLALEMETGGFMEAAYERSNAKTLIIRAISDYGDEHKKKLDAVGKGIIRRYALHNAIQLLWSLFEEGINSL